MKDGEDFKKRQGQASFRVRPWLRKCHSWVKEFQAWGVFLTAFALVFAIIQFEIERGDTLRGREVSAWQVLSMNTPGLVGKRDALEFLNAEIGFFCFEWFRGRLDWWHEDENDPSCLFVSKSRSVLYGTNMSQPHIKTRKDCMSGKAGTFLQRVDLRRALLCGADLSSASMFKADLREARLTGSNFSCTHLMFARLNDAKLINANLTNARLRGADFTDADLTGTDLSGADMKEAVGLEQAQLDTACGSDDTKVPEGKSIAICKEPRGLFAPPPYHPYPSVWERNSVDKQYLANACDWD